MELSEIIKSDKDRLFILDNECFIIFTADDLIDEKPFIRIGNWVDLPPKSIPLIENIIVTDSITGNPCHEQFNIDPQFLSTNRYIGSRQTVQNYLDFQRNFGLDLNNVSIVDVEKDLPSLSKEKSISSKDAFLGIFYYNGNFKVEYNEKNLFNLKEYYEKAVSPVKLFELISNKYKETTQYAGSGILVIDNCPVFYKNRYFTIYQFPQEYQYFDKLKIDPAKIREILLPGSSLVNITDFVKWENTKNSLIKIYSNSKELFDSMQKLFPSVIIKREDFKGCMFDTGNGLSVENYTDTLNIKLTYRNVNPSGRKLVLAYLKEYSGMQQILKEKLDFIIVPYTIYEKANLFFKTTTVPVICIDDGNKNISRLRAIGSIILSEKIIYEFKKFEDLDSLIKDAIKLFSNEILIDSLNKKNFENIKEIFFEDIEIGEETEFRKIIEFINASSILQIYLNTTTDRKLSSEIRKILQKASLFDKKSFLNKKAFKIKSIIYFYDSSIYEFYESVDDMNDLINLHEDISKRIEVDRNRFKDLLSLYGKAMNKSKKEFTLLNNEIKKRKQDFKVDAPIINHKKITRNILRIKLKKIIKILSVILILIIIYFISNLGYKFYKEYAENKRIESERLAKIELERQRIELERQRIEKEKNERKELIAKYDIHVSDRDIYIYANKVARKNGYREIEYKALKEKNPNWIYPGNIFYLMDEEKIIVKKGDTLWDISDQKLMGINLEFYKLIEKIEVTNQKDEKLKLLDKAEDLAFSKKHSIKLNEIRKELGN